jgi:hypothetical protein
MMSTHPLTYEGILEMMERNARESDREYQKIQQMFQDIAERQKKTDEQLERASQQLTATQKEVGKLGSRIGDIIEHMVRGRIIKRFQTLGYDVTGCSPNKEFRHEKLGISGEIDLLLDDGPIGILIEVKTTLKNDHILEHIEKIENYRRYADAKGFGDKQHFIGAVAGAVIADNVAEFAQKNGMYVITQSGEAFEIVPSPEGFEAKRW